MNQYYLIAQLPSLDGITDSTPLPITEERFNELCMSSLGKKAASALTSLTLTPPREPETTGISIVDKWNNGERQLRLALGTVRAAKLKKNFECNEILPSELITTARLALDENDPLEAERFLDRYRMDFLESLRPTDSFSEEAVFYYGLKLKLIARIRNLSESRGRTAYRKIYNSILNKNEQEAEQ